MTYCIKHFDNFSKNEWDSFVENNPRGWLWHTYNFIKAKNTWKNHSNISFALTNEKNQIVSIFPLFLIKCKSLRVFNTPILENIGGWLIDDKISDASISPILMGEFKKLLTKLSCSVGHINFSSASLNQEIDPFFILGIQGKSAYVSVIDLTKSQAEIWNNFRKGHKSEIKKAKTQGVTFKFASSEDVSTYYRMHQAVCAKSLITPHPKEYFENIFHELLPQGRACIGAVYLNDELISMVNYGIYNNIAVYWTSACFDIAYKTGANHFLHWSMIQELMKQNITHLDMGEVFLKHASKKIEGIANFKTGFGGKLSPCFKSQFRNVNIISKIQTLLGNIYG